jgi:hypothetical protein
MPAIAALGWLGLVFVAFVAGVICGVAVGVAVTTMSLTT